MKIVKNGVIPASVLLYGKCTRCGAIISADECEWDIKTCAVFSCLFCCAAFSVEFVRGVSDAGRALIKEVEAENQASLYRAHLRG